MEEPQILKVEQANKKLDVSLNERFELTAETRTMDENPTSQDFGAKIGKLSSLLDSDTDSEFEQEVTQHQTHVHELTDNMAKQKNGKLHQSKVFQNKDLVENQTIQSEQQRLQRETYISIPYHKPKKYTLDDFLKRRTIIKSQKQNKVDSHNLMLQMESLKMTQKELEKYAKLMDDRAMEATDFFQSDYGNNNKGNELLPNQEKTATLVDETSSVKILFDTNHHCSKQEPLKSKLIITEVLELPKLNLKQVRAKSLHGIPALKQQPIDPETRVAKHPTKIDSLLQRLIFTNKSRKGKTKQEMNLLSTSNNNFSMSKSNHHIVDESHANHNRKPGEAYFKLKENLRSVIAEKRIDDIKKKQELNELKDHLNAYDDVCITESDDDDQDGCDDISESDSNDIESKTEKRQNVTIMKTTDTNTIAENEKRIVKNELKEDDQDSDGSSRENPSYGNVSKSELNVFSTSNIAIIVPLFEEQSPQNQTKDEINLLELCSGRFDVTQKADPLLISQIPITQVNHKNNEIEECLALCSGTFAESCKGNSGTTLNETGTSSDECFPNETRIKKYTKKMNKWKIKLGFSDDEEEDGATYLKESSKLTQDVPISLVDYDSEENEIVVEMTKEECVAHAGKFFEKEAEISESDWNSADEDEKNMNQYDIELGDEDEFDREKLQTELGQIHARKILDEDIREVRRIKELLFEDAETDGRQRQFKWKKSEKGFALNDACHDDRLDSSGDEENEQIWRKIRYEREQLLQDKYLQNSQNIAENIVLSSSPITNKTPIMQSSVKKINIARNKTNMKDSNHKSPFLISKATSKLSEDRKLRPSFLLRDSEILQKLATCVKYSDVAATDGLIPVKPGNSNNFVFTAVSTEKPNKRKVDDLLDTNIYKGTTKKSKVEEHREDGCLIDQLL